MLVVPCRCGDGHQWDIGIRLDADEVAIMLRYERGEFTAWSGPAHEFVDELLGGDGCGCGPRDGDRNRERR